MLAIMYFQKLIIAFAASLLLLLANRADACSCAGWPTPCQAYQAASAVFIGYVSDVRLIEGPEWANIKYPPGTDMADHIGQYGVGSWEYKDNEGRYKFKEVPPGKYLLGVNLDRESVGVYPFPRTFYPDVDNAARATVIELGDLQKITNYDIHLPPRLRTRTVEGIVLWSDGQPVTSGRVSLKNTDDKGDMKIGYADGALDNQGHFS